MVQIDQEQLLDRFLRYVRVDTQANPATDEYPSSHGQIELGKVLRQELMAMGLQDVEQDAKGLVWATLPANVTHKVPTIAFNSHLDTSPDASGANVDPRVIRDYPGGDIPLAKDTSKVIRVSENPELEQVVGCTLITTDGTTLLGGDDKAGVAIIMQAMQTLMDHPEIPHGELRVLFTCDEEIGRGVHYVDLRKLNASACYTLDGSGANSIDTETFSADAATVVFRGKNIHPSIAKDRMVNALRAAGHFLASLPIDQAPETTSGRQGFLHPHSCDGHVDVAQIKLLLRDFDTAQLTTQAEQIAALAEEAAKLVAGCEFELDVVPQYRNLGDGLAKRPEIVARAEKAHTRLGRMSRREAVRGGTDGSRLTELGLPTPNLSSGQHNPHSVLEWACLDEMVQATQVVVEIARVWSEHP